MIYQHLFDRVAEPQTVQAALVGCGDFGTPIVTQARLVPRLELRAVADPNVAAARRAFRLAGAPAEAVAVCDSPRSALRAWEAGKGVIVEDAMALMDLPVHVIATATRRPEAGAKYAFQALRHGKHVVMVDKEADSVVGPFLKRIADRAGLVYTTDDGDQPGLVMGLVSWARALGLEVLCAGHLHECRYRPEAGTLTREGYRAIPVGDADRPALAPFTPGEGARTAALRRRLTAEWRLVEDCGDALAHLAVVANGTGLLPDGPTMHRPLARLAELPELLCPVEEGGLLHTRGTVDLPTILLEENQPTVGGGVFAVVANADAPSREVMVAKGMLANRSHSAMLLYRPYHLCGAETAMSLLVAGLLRVPTGAAALLPQVDIAATAMRDLAAGETLSQPGRSGYDRDLRASLLPAAPLADGRPLPFFMLESQRLTVDVPLGTTITGRMVAPPQDSVLWALRREQDAAFFGGS